MSKSLNNVVDPSEYVEKYGTDALRYFLMKEIPTTDDGDFSRERFKVVYQSELANNIGNLVSRVIAMAGKYFDGKVPEADLKNNLMKQKVKDLWDGYEDAINAFDLKKALEQVAEFADFANRFVEETKPWVLFKEEKSDELKKSMYDLLEMIRQIALLLRPFMPVSAEKILGWLGYDLKSFKYDEAIQWGGLKEGQVLGKAEPLFMRVEES